MKRSGLILTIALIWTFCFCNNALAYTDYFRQGTEWTTTYEYIPMGPDNVEYSYRYHKIDGTVTLGTDDWMLLLQKIDNEEYKDYGALRVENGKVYFITAEELTAAKAGGEIAPSLLYDFSLEIGQTVNVVAETCSSDVELVVKKLSSIVNGTSSFETMVVLPVSSNSETFTDEWIKGIGSLAGLLVNVSDYRPSDSGSYLSEVKADGTVVYSLASGSASIGMNPADVDSADSAVYDLSGKPLRDSKPKGLYIKNGKINIGR